MEGFVFQVRDSNDPILCSLRKTPRFLFIQYNANTTQVELLNGTSMQVQQACHRAVL